MRKRKILSAVLVLALLAVLMIIPAMAEGAVTEVATYDELIAALSESDEIKLTDDIFYSNGYNDNETLKIEAGKNITLDLNGHTVGQKVVDKGASVAAIAVRAGATLTVKDSSEGKTGRISACNTAIQLEGTLNLQSGTIAVDNPSPYDANPDTGFSFGVWCYMRSDEAVGPVFNMTGGTIDISDTLLETHKEYNFANAVACGDGASGVAARYEKASINITAGTVDGTLIVGEGTAVIAPEAIPLYCVRSDGYAVDAVAALTDGEGAKKVYSSLQAALDAAKDGDTIEIQADQTLTAQHIIEKAVTINGNGFKLSTSTVQKLIRTKADVTINNLTIENTCSGGRCIETRAGGIELNLNNVTLLAKKDSTQVLTVGGNAGTDGDVIVNLDSCHIDSGAVGYGIITFNPVKLTIKNSTAVSGYGALYLKPADSSLGSAGSVVDIKGSTLTSNGRSDGYTFATIILQDNNITLNVDKDSELIATNPENSTGRQYAVMIQNVDKDNKPAVYAGITVNVGGKLTSDYLISNLTSLDNVIYVPAAYKDALEAFTVYEYFTTAADDGLIRVWAAHTHDLKRTEAAKATYTQPGNTAYYSCSVCGAYFEDAAGTKQIFDKNTVVIPANNSGEFQLNVPKKITQTQKSYYLFTPSESGMYSVSRQGESPLYDGYRTQDTVANEQIGHEFENSDDKGNCAVFYKLEAGKTYAFGINGAGEGTFTIEKPVAPASIEFELWFEKTNMDDWMNWTMPMINYVTVCPYNAYADLDNELTFTSSDEKIVSLGSGSAWDWMEPNAYGKVTITAKLGSLTASDTVEVIPHSYLVPGKPVTTDGDYYTYWNFIPTHSGTYTLTAEVGEEGLEIECGVRGEELVLKEAVQTAGTKTYKLKLEGGKEYLITVYPGQTPTLTLGTEHELKKVDAVAATYTAPGNVEHYHCAACDKNYADAESKTELAEVVIPQLIKVEEEKAEVSTDAVDNAIADAKEKAEETGKPVEVVIEVPKAPVVEEPEEGGETEPVQEVVKVELPVASLESVAKEEANLTVVLPSVTVTVDTEALKAVTEQAAGNTVVLSVEQVKEETLTEKQQEVVKKYDVAVTIKAEFICQETQEKIWTEDGNADKATGSVTVKMPFTPAEGTKGTDYKVLYIADDGTVKEIETAFENGHLVFALEHFSEYVVVNAAIKDNPATIDSTMIAPFMLLFGLSFAGVAVMVAGKKQIV